MRGIYPTFSFKIFLCQKNDNILTKGRKKDEKTRKVIDKMDIFGLLAFIFGIFSTINTLILLGIAGFVVYQLQKKTYDIGKIAERKIGNALKSTLGVKGNELNTAVRRVDKDVSAIFNTHVEELEEFLPGAKEYLDAGRPDLAVGGILGWALKLLPLFVNQSPNLPDQAKTAVSVASQLPIDKILAFINKIRKRPKKTKEEKSEKSKDEDEVSVPRSFS